MSMYCIALNLKLGGVLPNVHEIITQYVTHIKQLAKIYTILMIFETKLKIFYFTYLTQSKAVSYLNPRRDNLDL